MDELPTKAMTFAQKFKHIRSVLPKAFYNEIMRRTGKPKGSIVAVITGKFHSKGFVIEKALCEYAKDVLRENIEFHQQHIVIHEEYIHQIDSLLEEELNRYMRGH